jgi:hypothetical protein
LEDNRPLLYVQSFPNPGAKYQVAVDDPGGVLWGDRGDELIVLKQDNEVVSVRVSTVGGFQQGEATRLFKVAQGDFVLDVQRGEQRFLFGTPIDLSASSRLEVVMNWPALLEKR